MITLNIDVTDLRGKAQPGDKVILWKPDPAGSAGSAGRIIWTAPVTVRLVDGKASVPDVEPGPMRVHMRCRGLESTAPVTVTVPDGEGNVTLRSLFESQFEYEPPVVSAVQRAADNAAGSERAALSAKIRAEAAADRADARVDEALTDGANLVRNEVKSDADRAVAAREGAQVAQSSAEAAAGTASTAAADAAAAREGVDEAAAAATAAAGVVQEATEPLPQLLTDIEGSATTGLSQIADARASALSALDAKAQQSLVPRVDTTVGTRVFVGDTMIFGDTGWRDVTSLLVNGWAAKKVLLRRQGAEITLILNGLVAAGATDNEVIRLGSGWINDAMQGDYLSIPVATSVDNASVMLVGSTYADVRFRGRPADVVSNALRWSTTRPWPTALPGTPA